MSSPPWNHRGPEHTGGGAKRRRLDATPVIAALCAPLDPTFRGFDEVALKQVVAAAWPDDCKIPVESRLYQDIIAAAPDASDVIRVTADDELADLHLQTVVSNLAFSPYFKDDKITEDDYHSGHDAVFTALFALVKDNLEDFYQFRNATEDSANSTTKRSARPDMSKVYHNMLIYQAEEKKERSSDDPAQELIDKLGTWTVVSRGDTTFLLCHTAVGWKIKFHALLPGGALRQIAPAGGLSLNMVNIDHRFEVRLLSTHLS